MTVPEIRWQVLVCVVDGIKAKVVAVNIDGLVRTKNDIIMESVKDLFQVSILQVPVPYVGMILVN